MLNDRVDLPVDIQHVRTTRLSQYSRNRYVDPTDNTEWEEDDLSSRERGHIYQYRQEGEGFRIHCPYRIVDADVGGLLQKLKSFWALDPTVMSVQLPASARRNPCVALQDFSLSTSDFSRFRAHAIEQAWVLEKDEVDVPVLLGNIQESIDALLALPQTVEEFCKEWCRSAGATTPEQLERAMVSLGRIRGQLDRSRGRRQAFAHQLLRLGRETDKRADYIQVEGRLELLNNTLQGVEALPLDRYEREAVHLFRVNTGAEAIGATGHLRPLVQELQDLRLYHPSLRAIHAEGADTLVRMEGLTIRFTPTGIVVEGDPAVLRVYLGATEMTETAVRSNRFRGIVVDPPAPPKQS